MDDDVETIFSRYIHITNHPEQIKSIDDLKHWKLPDDFGNYVKYVYSNDIDKEDLDNLGLGLVRVEIEHASMSDIKEREDFYMTQLLQKMFVHGPFDQGSIRLALNRILSHMPPLKWEIHNVIKYAYIEGEFPDYKETLSVENYKEGSFDINKLLRDFERYGEARVDWPLYEGTKHGHYAGPDFAILDPEKKVVHPFQFIQWLIAMSEPLPVSTHVFRWANGEERDLFQSLEIGQTIETTGYLSTSIIPWLTFEFCNPREVRDDYSAIFFPGSDWDGVDAMRTEDGNVVKRLAIDWSKDLPYGIMIELPVRTRCLYIPSKWQAEILLAHKCTLRLKRSILLEGGEKYGNRNIPFFIFDLVDDGIPFA